MHDVTVKSYSVLLSWAVSFKVLLHVSLLKKKKKDNYLLRL